MLNPNLETRAVKALSSMQEGPGTVLDLVLKSFRMSVSSLRKALLWLSCLSDLQKLCWAPR